MRVPGIALVVTVVALGACGGRPAHSGLRPLSANLTTVVTGPAHTCGLDAEGRAFCWGEGSSGELGTGSLGYGDRPTPVVGDLRFAALALTFTRTCGVTTDGRAFCWGANPRSDLIRGLRNLQESARGTPVPVAEERRFIAIGVGRDYACGITGQRALYCWGARGAAEVGRGFTALTVGAEHACALDAAGRAWCWGLGVNGELGTGAPERRTDSPMPVAGGFSFVSISAGERFTCGATRSGDAYCWGQNHLGQLGAPASERCSGGYPCATRPQRVPLSARVHTVSAGDSRTCALGEGGAVYCWGGGPKAVVNRWAGDTARPRPVPLGQTLRSLSVSGLKACGVTTAGETVCWSALLGLPRDPASREGSRMVTRWFLLWSVGGAALGLVIGMLVGLLRSGAWSAAGAVAGALSGFAVGIALALVFGFFKVLESLPW